MKALVRALVGVAGAAGTLSVLAQTVDYPAELPPAAAVATALESVPEVRAARAGVGAGEAERRQLSAGPYEWAVKVGAAQRRVNAPEPSARFAEWNVDLERTLRLPGKSALDQRLGEQGVAQAQIALAAAGREAAQRLLRRWYEWLREQSAAELLRRQADALGREASGVARRVALGDASQLEQLQTEAAAAQAEAAARLSAGKSEAAAAVLRGEFPEIVLPERFVLPEPAAPGDDLETLLATALREDPLVALAGADAERGRLAAARAQADRRPDPTVGVSYSRERAGEENVVGIYLSIPIGAERRRATAALGHALATAAEAQAAAVRRRAEAALRAREKSVRAAYANWRAARDSAERLAAAAEKITRARALGEVEAAAALLARRQADAAELIAASAGIDALEAQRSLALDARALWGLEMDAALR